MKTMTMGDFYVWYCEWCDSRNLTPWRSATEGAVSCGCCHKQFGLNLKGEGGELDHEPQVTTQRHSLQVL